MAYVYLGDEQPDSRDDADNYFFFDGDDPRALARILEKLKSRKFAGRHYRPRVENSQKTLCCSAAMVDGV